MELDLGSLESVRQFAEGLDADALDLLVNNAGDHVGPTAVAPRMASSSRSGPTTSATSPSPADSWPGSTGPRHPAWSPCPATSIRRGHLHFDDLQLDRRYGPRKAYRQSKLANAAFGLELDRRLRAAGSPIKSVLAHPGYTATNIQSAAQTGAMKQMMKLGNRLIGQSVEQGTLPTLYAATAPDVEGGEYFGPDGLP